MDRGFSRGALFTECPRTAHDSLAVIRHPEVRADKVGEASKDAAEASPQAPFEARLRAHLRVTISVPCGEFDGPWRIAAIRAHPQIDIF
jgi:hypothetical protein